MIKAKELRKITNSANEKLKREERIEQEKFLNGDMFKNILSAFEQNAFELAKEGKFASYIKINKHFEKMLIYAMQKSGYSHIHTLDCKDKDFDYEIGFMW